MPETVASALGAATAMLRTRSDSPRADALLLLAHALHADASYVVAHGDDVVAPETFERYFRNCERRRAGVPIAYVIGSAGFYGREFVVDDRVLVPRPESESLIDAALAFAAECPARAPVVLDVGTGSGALACTLAAELPAATVDATDRSPGAVAVAVANARALGVDRRCTVHLGDLGEPVAGRRYDVLIANLPYVESDAIPAAPSPLAFEPRLALDGGADGLRTYAAFVPSLAGLLAPGGLALLEAGSHQIAALASMARGAYPGAQASTGRDLSGSERFVCLRAPGRAASRDF